MAAEVLPRLGVDGRILEGIVTTHNPDGAVNISPLGPIVDTAFTTLVLRPFRTSTTYGNLIRTRRGILHVTDDVELIAATAVGQAVDAEFCDDQPLALARACRWYAFEVVSVDDTEERSTLIAKTQTRHYQREFFGFNRAQHAVIEAAILATRLHLLSTDHIAAEYARLQILVDKTGAATEQRAFDLLKKFVAETDGATRFEQVPP